MEVISEEEDMGDFFFLCSSIISDFSAMNLYPSVYPAVQGVSREAETPG